MKTQSEGKLFRYKEITLIKTQVGKAVVKAKELEIKNNDNLIEATDVLSKIKRVGKMIKDTKEGITKPMNEALKNARELFRPIEEDWANAEWIVKNKMVIYQTEQDRIAKEKEAKIAERVENGTLKFETGVRKIDEIQKVESVVEGKNGSINFKKIKKVIITDEQLIPRKYLEPNMVLIRAEVLAGVEIPGTKIVEESIVACK